VTQEGRHSARLEECVQASREKDRENRLSKILRGDGERKQVANWLIPHCQEKPLTREQVPVPKTDTGRRGENPKARERTLVKELGKMTP
jgi:hypothetical protein